MPDTPALYCRWILNAPADLDPDRCREQLADLKTDGYDGIVIRADAPPPAAVTQAAAELGLAISTDGDLPALDAQLTLATTPADLLDLAAAALAPDAAGLVTGVQYYWPTADPSIPGQCTWREALPAVLDAIRQPAAAPTDSDDDAVDCPIRWDPIEPDPNALALIVQPTPGDDPRQLQAVFHMRDPIDATLLFTQSVETVRLNGQPLPVESHGALQLAVITGELLSTDNLLQFRATDDAPRSASLLGDFSVVSTSDWTSTADGLLTTDGPLALTDFAECEDTDLIRHGFPCLYRPAVMAGTFRADRSTQLSAISLSGIDGEAAQLAIDGEIIGWTWGPHWRLPLALKLAPGVHDIELALAPPSTNYYYAPPKSGPSWAFRPCTAPSAVRLHA